MRTSAFKTLLILVMLLGSSLGAFVTPVKDVKASWSYTEDFEDGVDHFWFTSWSMDITNTTYHSSTHSFTDSGEYGWATLELDKDYPIKAPFTVGCWFRVPSGTYSYQNGGTLLLIADSGGNYILSIGCVTNSFEYSTPYDTYTMGVTVSPSTWYHLSISVDAEGVVTYAVGSTIITYSNAYLPQVNYESVSISLVNINGVHGYVDDVYINNEGSPRPFILLEDDFESSNLLWDYGVKAERWNEASSSGIWSVHALDAEGGNGYGFDSNLTYAFSDVNWIHYDGKAPGNLQYGQMTFVGYQGGVFDVMVYGEEYTITRGYPSTINEEWTPIWMSFDLYIDWSTHAIHLFLNGEYAGTAQFDSEHFIDTGAGSDSQIYFGVFGEDSCIDDIKIGFTGQFPPLRGTLLWEGFDYQNDYIADALGLWSEGEGTEAVNYVVDWGDGDAKGGGASVILTAKTGSNFANIAYLERQTSTVKISNTDTHLVADFWFNAYQNGLTGSNSDLFLMSTAPLFGNQIRVSLLSDNHLRLSVYDCEEASLNYDAGLINEDQWYHVTLKMDLTDIGRVLMYLDGVYVGSLSCDLYNGSTRNIYYLQLGCTSIGPDDSIVGFDELRIYNVDYMDPRTSFSYPGRIFDFETEGSLNDWYNMTTGGALDGDVVYLSSDYAHNGYQSLKIENNPNIHTSIEYDLADNMELTDNLWVSYWVYIRDWEDPGNNQFVVSLKNDNDGTRLSAVGIGQSGAMDGFGDYGSTIFSNAGGYYPAGSSNWGGGSPGLTFWGDDKPMETGRWVNIQDHYFISDLDNNGMPVGAFETYVDGDLYFYCYDVDNSYDRGNFEYSLGRWLGITSIHGWDLYIDDLEVWADSTNWIYVDIDEGPGEATQGFTNGTKFVPDTDGEGARLYPSGSSVTMVIDIPYGYVSTGYYHNGVFTPNSSGSLTVTVPDRDSDEDSSYWWYIDSVETIPFDGVVQFDDNGDNYGPGTEPLTAQYFRTLFGWGNSIGWGDDSYYNKNMEIDNRIYAKDASGYYHFLYVSDREDGYRDSNFTYARSLNTLEWNVTTFNSEAVFGADIFTYNPSGYFSSYSDLATDSRGNVHAVFYLWDADRGSPAIFYGRIQGEAITDIQRLGDYYGEYWGYYQSPLIEIDSLDYARIVWIGEGEDNDAILYRTRSPVGAWSSTQVAYEPNEINDPNYDGFKQYLSLSVDNNNKNRVLFTTDQYYVGYDDYFTTVRYVTDASGSWSSPVQVSTIDNVPWDAGFVASTWSDDSGLNVVYADDQDRSDAVHNELHYRALARNGTWGSDLKINDEAYPGVSDDVCSFGTPSLMTDGDKVVHIVFGVMNLDSYASWVVHLETPLVYDEDLEDYSGGILPVVISEYSNYRMPKVRNDRFVDNSPYWAPSNTTETYILNLRRYENGTIYDAPYTASIQLSSGYLYTKTVTADNTIFETSGSIWSFTYPLVDPDEYRTLYAPSSPITPLIPGPTSDQYLFTIHDLTGYLTGKTAYLEAWRTVGVNSYVVDTAIVNGTVNGFPLTLERGQIVQLKLLLPDGVSRYSFGYFTPTGNPLTHTLIFNYIGFDNTMHVINAYVSATAIRDGSEIDVVYANTLLGYDVSATALLYLRNGTLVDTATSTLDADTMEFTGLTTSEDYVVKLQIEHSYFSGTTIKKSWGFAGSWSPTDPLPFPDPSTMGWTVGGVSNIIGVGIILFVAGVFSFASAPLGITLTVIVAGVMASMGIVSIPVDLLALAFSLAIIYAIGRREK